MLKRITAHGKELEIEIDDTSKKRIISVVGQETPYAVSNNNEEFFLYDRSVSGRINKIKSLLTTSIDGAIEGMWKWGHFEDGTYKPMKYDIEQG